MSESYNSHIKGKDLLAIDKVGQFKKYPFPREEIDTEHSPSNRRTFKDVALAVVGANKFLGYRAFITRSEDDCVVAYRVKDDTREIPESAWPARHVFKGQRTKRKVKQESAPASLSNGEAKLVKPAAQQDAPKRRGRPTNAELAARNGTVSTPRKFFIVRAAKGHIHYAFEDGIDAKLFARGEEVLEVHA